MKTQCREEWVEYSFVLSQLSGIRERRRKEYKDFIAKGYEGESESPLREPYGQVILGTGEFIERVKGVVRGGKISEEIVDRKRLKERLEPQEILRVVSERYGEEPEALRARGRNKTARKVAIYLMKKYWGLSNLEAAKQFGGLHYSAVTKTCTRL